MTSEKPYDPELLALLKPRTHERELHGLRGGSFSPDRTKFFAYTYARLDSVDYDDFRGLFLDYGSNSSAGADSERQKKWIDEHSYQGRMNQKSKLPLS